MAVVVVAAVCDRGESVAALQRCDRTGALLAASFKYTQTRCARWRHFLLFCPTVFMCWFHPLSRQCLDSSRSRERHTETLVRPNLSASMRLVISCPVSRTVWGHLVPDVYSAWVNCLLHIFNRLCLDSWRGRCWSLVRTKGARGPIQTQNFQH